MVSVYQYFLKYHFSIHLNCSYVIPILNDDYSLLFYYSIDNYQIFYFDLILKQFLEPKLHQYTFRPVGALLGGFTVFYKHFAPLGLLIFHIEVFSLSNYVLQSEIQLSLKYNMTTA